MSAIIYKVRPDSLADELGLEPGDKILKINGETPKDLIDFQFLWSDSEIELLVEKKNKEKMLFEIEKDIDEGLGVEFEQAVFDRIINCHNKCLFCFIDQMGPAMRPSLYEKDDDYRLSFLQGNFITLTNLRPGDFERIKELHLSPLYVSVHTTNPLLRIELLRNKKAGLINSQLDELIKAGINIHTQIVLCPGINDGESLDKTIEDLSKLWPGVRSIAIVPVGVTRFRKDLSKFPEFTKDYSKHLIEKVAFKQSYFRKKLGKTLVYLGDEIYIRAGMDFPKREYYDDFPQTENGVGLSRLFLDEFKQLKTTLPPKVSPRRYIILTGVLAQHILKPVVQELEQVEGVELELKVVENNFFGPRVTVAGLLTGKDLLTGLQGVEQGAKVIFPDVLLKQGDNIFLDNLSPEEIEKSLNIELIPVPATAKGLINAVIYN